MKRKASPQAPPRGLSAAGKHLWSATVAEYEFEGAADLALLAELCQAFDGARACRARIARDGLMVDGSAGQPRPHPLLAIEDAYRRSMLACVRALRLTSAPEL